MKTTYVCVLASLLSITSLSADADPERYDLIAPLAATYSAPMSTTSEGSAVASDPEEAAQLLARADDDDEQGGKAKGKGKSKGKGKAKGHDKDKEKNGNSDDTESQSGNAQPTPPAARQPTAVTPAPTEAPTAARAPAVSTRRSPAELKTEMDQRLKRITALDKNTATSRARDTVISKETGVPVAQLQAQRKAHPVGSGGILIANELAKATGKPATTFLKQRLQGREWDKIAADNRFDLAPVVPKLERLQKAMEAVPQPARR